MWKQYLLIILVIVALVPSSFGAKRKVLIDCSHDERIGFLIFYYGDQEPCFDIFEDTYEMVESHEEITYRAIQDYDMLLVWSPQRNFDSSEIEVIAQFVSNGGGMLIILGIWNPDHSELKSIHSLSEFFGVKFVENLSHGTSAEVFEIQDQSHPIFKKVKRIVFHDPHFITVAEPSKELLYHEEGEGSLVACCEYGKGRVIFLPASEPLLYPYVDVSDNKQFITNIFNWLTEPGGPYMQQKEDLNKGITLMEKGKEQIEGGEFILAKSTLAQSKNYLESALTVYESDTTQDMIETLNSLLADCEIGAKAETLYQEGVSLYESGDYSTAVLQLQEAQQLFQSINVENEECASLIQECETRMETERNKEQADTLLSEGIAYFEEQQYDSAKTKFEEALSIYTELQDSEKVTECEEWVTSTEEFLDIEPPTMPIGTIFGIAIVLSVAIGGLILQLRKKKPEDVHKQETEKKQEQETEKKVPEEETEPKPKKIICPFCKNEIEEDWIACPHCGIKLKEDTQVY